jgi:hypothetical protein
VDNGKLENLQLDLLPANKPATEPATEPAKQPAKQKTLHQ